MGDRQRRGRTAEDLAEAQAHRLGLTVLGRNVRVGHLEIDLICRDSDVIVVVEVRARGAGAWQSAMESLDDRKRARVRAAGERLWASRFSADLGVRTMRFDFVAVDLRAHPPSVEWVRAAF